MSPDARLHDDSLVFSYLAHRRVIGILGAVFPVLLYLGGRLVFDVGLQNSLSHYYHTGMGDVFVGILFVIGFFLLSYHGYGPVDRWAGNLACVFAAGVALFPTSAPGATGFARTAGIIHYVCAVALFASLIFFSGYLFRKTAPGREPEGRKVWRNHVYLGCAVLMTASMLAVLASKLTLPDPTPDSPFWRRTVFWGEAIAIEAFAVSWLVKGEALRFLNDRPDPPGTE